MNARRQLLHAALCAGAALLAGRRSFAAATAVQTREVSGFHEIDWTGAGELTLEQTGREQLTVEAEPLVLAKMITGVRGKQDHRSQI